MEWTDHGYMPKKATTTMTNLDPVQVGREAAAKLIPRQKAGGRERIIAGHNDKNPTVAACIAGATEMLARLSAAPAPDGVWVPREPTEAMVQAAFNAQQSASSPVCKTIYRAMLAAAPAGEK